MITVKTKTRKWGNSIGIVIPKDAAERENLMQGEEVELLLLRKSNVLRESFGLLKGKLTKSTDEILKEIDRELWGINRE